MGDKRLVRQMQTILEETGLNESILLRESYDPENFGNSEAVFKAGPIILRFLRDRGQDFLDLGFESEPDHFYQADDVFIVFGWSSIDEVLNRTEPLSLTVQLNKISANWSTLIEAFSKPNLSTTRQKIQEAAYGRGSAFLRKLS